MSASVRVGTPTRAPECGSAAMRTGDGTPAAAGAGIGSTGPHNGRFGNVAFGWSGKSVSTDSADDVFASFSPEPCVLCPSCSTVHRDCQPLGRREIHRPIRASMICPCE